MGFADEAKKAEELAKKHPQQGGKAVEEGEKAAEDHTGHRYDEQIGEDGEQVERRIAGGQDQQQAPEGGADGGQSGS